MLNALAAGDLSLGLPTLAPSQSAVVSKRQPSVSRARSCRPRTLQHRLHLLSRAKHVKQDGEQWLSAFDAYFSCRLSICGTE